MYTVRQPDKHSELSKSPIVILGAGIAFPATSNSLSEDHVAPCCPMPLLPAIQQFANNWQVLTVATRALRPRRLPCAKNWSKCLGAKVAPEWIQLEFDLRWKKLLHARLGRLFRPSTQEFPVRMLHASTRASSWFDHWPLAKQSLYDPMYMHNVASCGGLSLWQVAPTSD